MDWLRRQRRLNELQLELMAERFDFDGALAAQQVELAGWAMLRIVVAAARLYLYERGVTCPEASDWTSNTRTLLDHLAALDSELAQELWQYILKPLPATLEDLQREAAGVLQFANERLQAKQVNRDATVRDWADGVRLLREVAVGLKIAGADSWYIRADDSDATLTWYDEVMSQLAAKS